MTTLSSAQQAISAFWFLGLLILLLTACTAGPSKIPNTHKKPSSSQAAQEQAKVQLSELERKLKKYKDKPDFPAQTGECANEKFLSCLHIDNQMCAKIFKVSAFDCREKTQQEFNDSFNLKDTDQYLFMQHCIAGTLLDNTQNPEGATATKICLITE